MNITSIISIASYMFGDPNKEHVNDTDWLVLANKAERELARFTKSIVSRVSCDDFVAGTYLYSLANGGWAGAYDIVQVLRVILNYDEMHPTGELYMKGVSGSDAFRKDASASRNTPEYWYVARHNYLGIYPIPDSTSTSLTPVTADIAHLPTTDIVAGATPELNVLFHDDLAMYMAYLACILDKESDRATYLMGLLRESLMSNTKLYVENRGFIIPTDVGDLTEFDDTL